MKRTREIPLESPRKRTKSQPRSGFGKGTQILMASGDVRNIEDLKEREMIMGADSIPRKIMRCLQGIDELFRVAPSGRGKNGCDSYVISDNHELSLVLSRNPSFMNDKKRRTSRVHYIQKHKLKLEIFHWVKYETPEEAKADAKRFVQATTMNNRGDTINIRLHDYFNQLKTWKVQYMAYQVGVQFEKRDITLDPYMLGVWLGDGCHKGTAITNRDPEIIAFLRSFTTNMNLGMTETRKKEIVTGYTMPRRSGYRNPFTTQLHKYKIYGNKHIPDDFLLNTQDIRLQLLAGLLDTDGSFNSKLNLFSITQARQHMAEQILFLARSLGFRATIRKVPTGGYPTKMRFYHKVHIGGPNLHLIPTKVGRKRAAQRDNDKRVGVFTTVDVHSIGQGAFHGIELEGNNGLIVLGDYTVVHV